MLTTEHGVVREVWFATLTDPTTKHSFLIRDDSYLKSGAVFGRTVRLGDPVTLGPNGAWRQLTWEGGNDQEQWADEAMFKKGTADTSSSRGKAKLHPALGTIYEELARANVGRLALGRNAADATRASASPLFIGEDNPFNVAVPLGGFRLYRKDPGGGFFTIKSDFASGIRAFSPPDDNSPNIYIGCANGEVWKYDQGGGTIVLDYTEPAGAIEFNSMELYQDSLYWLSSNHLVRRYNDGTTTTYTGPFKPAGIQALRGIAVWNGKLWFAGITPNRATRIFVWDGTTGVEAVRVPGEFEVMGLRVHYGSLYICGSSGGADRVAWKGQVWRYTGSSLQKVYEAGTGDDTEDHTIWDMETDGPFLCWPQHARPSNGYVSGIVRYDAELDAISLGPNRSEGAARSVHSIESYDNTLVIDTTSDGGDDAWVRPVRKLGRVRVDLGSNIEQYVLSSRYDGEIPGEKKVWLTGRVRCKVPQFTEVEVRLLLDEGSTEFTVKTVTYDAGLGAGWRTVTFPLHASSGEYFQSTTLQYKLVLRNTETTNTETVANPEVDSIEVEFMPSPSKRRQWRARLLASNAQQRLDGSNNPLSTTQALVDKLEELWARQLPLLYWDAGSTGGVPPDATTAVEVFVTDFSSQPYRVASDATDINSEVQFSMVEVVQS